jgi:hypothetical protein
LPNTLRTHRPKLTDGSQSFHFKITKITKESATTTGEPGGIGGRPVHATGKAAAHQKYIERAGALDKDGPQELAQKPHEPGQTRPLDSGARLAEDQDATLTSGAPLIFTNIAPTIRERAAFWKSVEANERTPGPARIRVRPTQDPNWWSRILSMQPPAEIPTILKGGLQRAFDTIEHTIGTGITLPNGAAIAGELVNLARYHPLGVGAPLGLINASIGQPPKIDEPKKRAKVMRWAKDVLTALADAPEPPPIDLVRAYQAVKAGTVQPTRRDPTCFEVPIDAAHAQDIQRWLKAQFGRRKKPPAEIVENRHGVIQFRVIMELPHELSATGRINIARATAEIFAKKNIPYSIVIHKPDANNDQRNWHCHLIYYDRPAARMPDGKWDFEVIEYDREHARLTHPHRQRKDRDITAYNWPMKFRARYAEIVNTELTRENVAGKRFDPRSYEDMGITKKPEIHHDLRQPKPVTAADATDIADAATAAARRIDPAAPIHLATNAVAQERKGLATPTGTAAAVVHSIKVLKRADADYHRANDAALAEVETWATNSQTRPLAAEYLSIRRRMAALRRQRALYQEALRAAVSRPTAALHYSRESEQKLVDHVVPNQAVRLAAIRRKIALHEKSIADLKRQLAPYWDILETRRESLIQDIVRLPHIQKAALDILRTGTVAAPKPERVPQFMEAPSGAVPNATMRVAEARRASVSGTHSIGVPILGQIKESLKVPVTDSPLPQSEPRKSYEAVFARHRPTLDHAENHIRAHPDAIGMLLQFDEVRDSASAMYDALTRWSLIEPTNALEEGERLKAQFPRISHPVFATVCNEMRQRAVKTRSSTGGVTSKAPPVRVR